MNKNLLEDVSKTIDIDGESYKFNIDNIATEIIEFISYFKYDEINAARGPVEKRLKDFTYGKNFNELSEHEVYDIRFSKFKIPIEGDEHELEITGVGPTALKVSLFVKKYVNK